MHMAINEQIMARKRTKREDIDEMLLKACNLARENDQTAIRLRGLLIGATGEEQRPERPSRPGWFGEIADALEVMIEYLGDTAKILEEVSQECGCALLDGGAITRCPKHDWELERQFAESQTTWPTQEEIDAEVS